VIKRLSIFVVVSILLITFATILPISKLRFNYNIDSFFSKSDPDISYYNEFKKTFGNENDFILIGIKSKNTVFKQNFLVKLDSLTHSLSNLEQVISIQSPTNLSRYVKSPIGFIPIPIIHIDNPSKYHNDSLLIYNNPDFIGSFFSPNSRSVCLLLKKDSINIKAYNDKLLDDIDEIISQFNFDEYHIGGRIKSQNYYISRLNHDIIVLGLLAIIILIVFLWLTFRSLWGIWLPGIVLLISLIWVAAFIRLLGSKPDMLTIMLPTLIFVIGISDSIHLISKYIEELRKGQEKLIAIKITIKEIGLATFLTSLTTAIGFFSILIIDIAPLQRFGIISGVGIIITYFISILMLPAVFVLMPTPAIAKRNVKDAFWTKSLDYFYNVVIRNKLNIIIVSLIITLIFAFGITKVVVNNSYLDDLTDESTLKKDLVFFEDNFSGIRPVEIGIEILPENITLYNVNVLTELDKVENYLRNEYKAGFIVSPLSFIKNINQAINGGNSEYYRIPKTDKELKKLKLAIDKLEKYKMMNGFVDSSKTKIRLTGKINDLGSVVIIPRNKAFINFINKEISAGLFDVHITGTAQLMDNTSHSISTKLLYGLALAFVIISLIIGLMFRSWRLIVISIIVNTIPLIIIGGLMGYTGVHLRVSTALIFSIVFGIAVDDTIHFLSKLKLEINKGYSVTTSLKNTYLTTGKAIIITSLILTSGFLTFVISEFQSTVTVGLNIFVALFLALFADLFLLPVLLLLMYRNDNKNTLSLRHRIKLWVYKVLQIN